MEEREEEEEGDDGNGDDDNPISVPAICKQSRIKPTTVGSSHVIILHRVGYK